MIDDRICQLHICQLHSLQMGSIDRHATIGATARPTALVEKGAQEQFPGIVLYTGCLTSALHMGPMVAKVGIGVGSGP